jgi:hypothetical protein
MSIPFTDRAPGISFRMQFRSVSSFRNSPRCRRAVSLVPRGWRVPLEAIGDEVPGPVFLISGEDPTSSWRAGRQPAIEMFPHT